MILRPAFTFSGEAAMARQAILVEVLRSMKLSCAKDKFMPWNMNVILGMVIGTL